MIDTGMPAPEFTLSSTPDQTVSLTDYRGRNVILAFYPADWSPVCSDQMSLYNNMLEYFAGLNAVLLGISVDSKWCHAAFRNDRNLAFPLLADFEPKGGVSSSYGVYDAGTGESMRSLFVIDAAGMVRWSHLAERTRNPGADGILDALESLESVAQ